MDLRAKKHVAIIKMFWVYISSPLFLSAKFDWVISNSLFQRNTVLEK